MVESWEDRQVIARSGDDREGSFLAFYGRRVVMRRWGPQKELEISFTISDADLAVAVQRGEKMEVSGSDVVQIEWMHGMPVVSPMRERQVMLVPKGVIERMRVREVQRPRGVPPARPFL